MICPLCRHALKVVMQPVRLLGARVSRRRVWICTRCQIGVRLQNIPREYDKVRRLDLLKERARAVLKQPNKEVDHG